jgi:hypothetical protein
LANTGINRSEIRQKSFDTSNKVKALRNIKIREKVPFF